MEQIEITQEIKQAVIEGLKSEGTILRTKEEESTFLENYVNNIVPQKVDEQIGSKIKDLYDRIDAEIFEATGKKKDPTEKTHAFNKRVLAELVAASKNGENKEATEQLKQLREKLKEYEDYVPKSEIEKIRNDYASKIQDVNISAALKTKNIAVPAHIVDDKEKEAFTNEQESLIKMAFKNKFTQKVNEQGQTVYYDGETLLMNASDALPMNEAQILEKYFSVYFAPVEKPQQGTGVKTGQPQAIAAESGLKTKADVTKYLNSKGLVLGGAEFTKEYSRILSEYGITD